jgi:hypothetical protein
VSDREERRDPRAPAFARAFPADAEVEALTAAFEAGDYRRVRDEGGALAARSPEGSVREAALELVRRTRPDPLAKWLFLLAATLMASLFGYWVAHDGPDPNAPKPPPPTIEYVK